MEKKEIENRIKLLEEEQEGEYEELDGDNGGRDTSARYWEIDAELEKLIQNVRRDR